MMQGNRYVYADHYDTSSLRRMLRDTEDRATRAETSRDALSDAYLAQEIKAAIELQSAEAQAEVDEEIDF